MLLRAIAAVSALAMVGITEASGSKTEWVDVLSALDQNDAVVIEALDIYDAKLKQHCGFDLTTKGLIKVAGSDHKFKELVAAIETGKAENKARVESAFARLLTDDGFCFAYNIVDHFASIE